jgi:hypothetical protein
MVSMGIFGRSALHTIWGRPRQLPQKPASVIYSPACAEWVIRNNRG